MKHKLNISATWVPTEGAARAWDQAIEILADGLAELAVAAARAELAAELGLAPESIVHGAPGLTDDARRAADLPLRARGSR